MLELFQMRKFNYDIPSQTNFFLISVNTSRYCLKSSRYLTPKILKFVPQDTCSANSISHCIMKFKS